MMELLLLGWLAGVPNSKDFYTSGIESLEEGLGIRTCDKGYANSLFGRHEVIVDRIPKILLSKLLSTSADLLAWKPGQRQHHCCHNTTTNHSWPLHISNQTTFATSKCCFLYNSASFCLCYLN